MKTSYLASDSPSVARRSRNLYRFLVASPLALLIVVAFVAHMPRPPYPHPAGDAAYDRKVLAYRERLLALREIDHASPEAQETEARTWVAGYASGELAPIPAAVYEDHYQSGVRFDIVRAGLDLAATVAQSAERDIAAGHAELGARRAMLAAQTAFGLRGFDVQAQVQCLLVVRRGTGLMLRAWPKVPDAAKAEMRERLKPMLIDRDEVEDLDRREAEQFATYLRRQRIVESDLDPGVLRARQQRVPEISAALRGAETSNALVRQLLGEPLK